MDTTQWTKADQAVIRRVVEWLRAELGARSAEVMLPCGQRVVVHAHGEVSEARS